MVLCSQTVLEMCSKLLDRKIQCSLRRFFKIGMNVTTYLIYHFIIEPNLTITIFKLSAFSSVSNRIYVTLLISCDCYGHRLNGVQYKKKVSKFYIDVGTPTQEMQPRRCLLVFETELSILFYNLQI